MQTKLGVVPCPKLGLEQQSIKLRAAQDGDPIEYHQENQAVSYDVQILDPCHKEDIKPEEIFGFPGNYRIL